MGLNGLVNKLTCPLLCAAILLAGPVRGEGFVDVPPARSGVEFVHSFAEDDERAFLYYSGFACGAVCIADVSGDGLPDLYFSDGSKEIALYLNRGGLSFAKSGDSGSLVV